MYLRAEDLPDVKMLYHPYGTEVRIAGNSFHPLDEYDCRIFEEQVNRRDSFPRESADFITSDYLKRALQEIEYFMPDFSMRLAPSMKPECIHLKKRIAEIGNHCLKDVALLVRDDLARLIYYTLAAIRHEVLGSLDEEEKKDLARQSPPNGFPVKTLKRLQTCEPA